MNTILKNTIEYLKLLSGRLALFFIVPAMSIWMVLAVWFSNLPGKKFPMIAAVIISAGVLIILAKVKNLRRAAGFIFCLFLVILSWHLLIAPSNNRNWHPMVKRLSTANFSETADSVMIKNIRNFEYRSEHDFDARYYDMSFALDKLQGVDLIVSYWGSEALAHTFLSFRFEKDIYLAVSIEIRPEIGESYHPIAGLFKQYEIIYVIGSERDLIRLRTNYRAEDTYLYESTATPGQARELYVDILNRVNQLAVKPAFYGTVRKNCTTSLVKHVNKVLEDDTPFSVKLLLNGFSDELAYMKGNIRNELPFKDLKSACYISDIAKSLDSDPEFSKKIRFHIRMNIIGHKNKISGK